MQKRNRYTDQERKTLLSKIKELNEGGESIHAACKKMKLSLPTYYYWLRAETNAPKSAKPKTQAQVPTANDSVLRDFSAAVSGDKIAVILLDRSDIMSLFFKR